MVIIKLKCQKTFQVSPKHFYALMRCFFLCCCETLFQKRYGDENTFSHLLYMYWESYDQFTTYNVVQYGAKLINFLKVDKIF